MTNVKPRLSTLIASESIERRKQRPRLRMDRAAERTASDDPSLTATADEVLAAFASMSRRIEDLARELKCLGYFDDGEDRPRAA